jgi:type VI protein secretion system component Hcp
MPQGDATDLFMKFVLNNKPIDGESTTNLTPPGAMPNELLNGFKPRKMFEIDRFTFQSGLIDDSVPAATTPANTGVQRNEVTTKPPTVQATSSTKGQFQAWRSGKSVPYAVDLKPVEFTRSIDKSSTTLIQSCIDCVPFDSASLIKRKAAGSSAAGEVFLRLDFIGVLVTGVDWSNDVEVQEKCSFICRGVTVSYRPQLPDGTLGGTIAKFWSMVPNATQPPYS